jgi:hypothetical protein
LNEFGEMLVLANSVSACSLSQVSAPFCLAVSRRTSIITSSGGLDCLNFSQAVSQKPSAKSNGVQILSPLDCVRTHLPSLRKLSAREEEVSLRLAFWGSVLWASRPVLLK